MWLDNLIGWVAPERGLARHQARQAWLEVRGYEAAKRGRGTANWNTTGASANADISRDLPWLRQRSRDLAQNNGYAVSLFDKFVAHAIGTGVIAKWSDDATQALWKEWVPLADADGQLDFYGLEALATRTVEESGECIVRLRTRLPEDGLPVPLQIQLLEPDYLDHLKTEDLPNGGYIINGVEFSPIGKVVAYWLFDRHPGEVGQLFRPLESHRVDAADVLLIYRKTRPGQVRGVPRLAPVIKKLRDLDDYEEAELMRKKIEACFAAFVTTSDQSRTLGQASASSAGPPRTKLSPGTIERLKPGETVDFANPSANNDGDFTRRQQRVAAAGAGGTYEQMTGDLSQVNYSSGRIGLIDFRAQTEQFRWLIFVPMFLTPIAARWLMLAKLSGKAKKATVEWIAPRWEYIDPVKDAKGDMILAAAGIKTQSDLWHERGYDREEQLRKLKQDREDLTSAGVTIIYDSETVVEPNIEPISPA
ncbi:phage portal protein [Silvimonas sp. JCM 19000]